MRDGGSGIEETSAAFGPGVSRPLGIGPCGSNCRYQWHVAGHTAGDSDLNGLGDVNVATGTAFGLGESWRIGGRLDLRIPSGSEPDLSANVWRLQEMGVLAWDATKNLTLSPSFEHNESLAEEPGASPEHFLEVFFPATVGLPQRWSATAKYEAKVDFQNDNTWTHSGKLAMAKGLERVPLSFSLSITKAFDGGEKTFQIDFIAAWFFRSKAPSSRGRQMTDLRSRTVSSAHASRAVLGPWSWVKLQGRYLKG